MSFESPATTGLSGCSKGSRMLIPIAISCPAPTCAASMIPSPPAPRHPPSEGARLSIAGGAGTAPRGSEYGHLSKTLKPREHPERVPEFAHGSGEDLEGAAVRSVFRQPLPGLAAPCEQFLRRHLVIRESPPFSSHAPWMSGKGKPVRASLESGNTGTPFENFRQP